MLEAYPEFQAPGFRLGQPLQLQAWGSEPQTSLLLCLSNDQVLEVQRVFGTHFQEMECFRFICGTAVALK